MTTKNDKPAIDFNFDTYRAGAKPDYAFVLGGRRHTIKNASQINGIQFFEKALKGDASATLHVLHEALDDDVFDEMRAAAPGIEALNEFVKGYLTHGGIGGAEGNPS